MKIHPQVRFIFSILSIHLLFSSCSTAQPNQPTNLPSEQAVGTIVAATMEALQVDSGSLSPLDAKPTPTMHGLWPLVPTDLPAAATPQGEEKELENKPPAGYDALVLRVAYYSGSELRLWTLGGAETLLYTGEPVGDICMSPDGWVIIFTTRNSEYFFTGLWRVNADGSDLRRLLEASDLALLASDPQASGVGVYQMEFAPGTRDLVFNTRLLYMGPGVSLQDDLRSLNTNTGKMTTLLDAGLGGAFYFSPDGGHLALVTPTSISLANSDGTKRREDVLTYPQIMTYSEYLYYPKLSWKTDGESVWAVVPSEDSIADDASMSVWQIPFTSGMPALKASYPAGLAIFFSGQVVSPDIEKIAYMERVGKPDANRWDLHIASLDGAIDNVVRSGKIRFIGWSPDGNWVTVEEEGVFVVGSSDGNFWSLAGNMPTVEMQWVDGERFLFLSGDYQAMELHLGRVRSPSQVIGPVSSDYMPFDFAPQFQQQENLKELNILGN